MNRTIKEATVKRFHNDSHAQLEAHLTDFIAAYNFGRRLKTLKDLTPYEYICKGVPRRSRKIGDRNPPLPLGNGLLIYAVPLRQLDTRKNPDRIWRVVIH
jgi:hypothetical protein